MNTQRNAAQILEEEIANAGVPPQGNQNPPLEEEIDDDQALVNPLPTFMDGDIRAGFLHFDHAITTQSHAFTHNLKP